MLCEASEARVKGAVRRYLGRYFNDFRVQIRRQPSDSCANAIYLIVLSWLAYTPPNRRCSCTAGRRVAPLPAPATSVSMSATCARCSEDNCRGSVESAAAVAKDRSACHLGVGQLRGHHAFMVLLRGSKIARMRSCGRPAAFSGGADRRWWWPAPRVVGPSSYTVTVPAALSHLHRELPCAA
jgi:hypothetical protein